MPDISKLTDLAEILGTTIDELLGKKNSVVEKLASSGDADVVGADREELAEAAEIIKPRTLEKLAGKEDAENIVPLLPFLSEKFVAQLAMREYSHGKSITAFLPFLDEDSVDGLLMTAVSAGKLEEIGQLLPFATGKAVARAVAQYIEEGREITVFLPFLEEEDLKRLALEAFEKKGLSGVGAFLPFLDEDFSDELAARLSKTDRRNAGC